MAGVQLDTVEPGALRSPRGCSVDLYDPRDVRAAEFRRRPLPAPERELGEGRSPVRMEVVREAAECGEQLIVMDPELIREPPTGRVHVEGADHDQSHPSLRPGGIETSVLLGHLPACAREVEHHGRHDQAVPDRKLADLAGAE
jgi:hypothetical protein